MTEPTEDKFPDLNQAVLGAAELAALFGDYRECASVDEILVKPGPGYVSSDSQPNLHEAHELLRTRAVRGVQIRYQFDGTLWCDTLLPVADGVRIVRIRQT